MKHTVAVAILAISLSASTGCTTMSDMGANMARQFRPRPFDESPEFQSHGIEDELSEMMREGRPIDDSDREPEDWYQKNVMSDRARSIERNLGF